MVGHRQRYIRLYLNCERVPALGAGEGVLVKIHQKGHRHRVRRQHTRLNAGHLLQAADQGGHADDQVEDDANKLAHFGGVQIRRVLQHDHHRLGFWAIPLHRNKGHCSKLRMISSSFG